MEPFELAYCEEVCSYLDGEILRLREESATLKREVAEAGRRFAAENPYGAVYQSVYSVSTEAGQHIAEMEKKLSATENNLAEAALRQLTYRFNVAFNRGFSPFSDRIGYNLVDRFAELIILDDTLHKGELLIKSLLRGIIVHFEFLCDRGPLLHHKIRIVARDLRQHMSVI